MNDTPIEEQDMDTPDEAVAESQAVYGEEPVAEAEDAEAPEGPRLVLKRSGQETDIAFPFSPPATIGRFDPSVGPVDVDLGQIEEGSYVSRKHARIVQEGDVYKIQDLGSSNGTYVLRDDFEKVEEAEIKDGDEVSLGNARFVFRA
jgi:pSer/pThr/pTyr-binding forkhead associated (FHA) protein